MVNKDSHGITVCGPHIHIDEGINTSRVESVGRQKSNPWHSVRSHHVLHHFIHNTARIGAQLFGSGARNTLLLLVHIKSLKSQISGTCTGFFRHKRLKPRKCANWCQSIRVCSDKITYGLHQAKNGHSDVWVLQTMDTVLKIDNPTILGATKTRAAVRNAQASTNCSHQEQAKEKTPRS